MRVTVIFAIVLLGVVLGRAENSEDGPFCFPLENRLQCYHFFENEIKLWKTSQLSILCGRISSDVTISPRTTVFNNLTYLAVQNCNVPTIIKDLDQSIVSHDFLEQLTLLNLQISVLPPGVFTKFNRLTHLDVSSNNITVVRPSTFPASLEDLDLKSNLIETIEDGAFDGLYDLQILRLNHNKLTVIPRGTFSQLTDLEILMLSNNKLQTLSGLIFNGLTSLKELYATDNEINEIAADTFKQLPNLKRLELANNKLTSLPRRLFSENKKIWLLSLTGNKITHIYGNTFKGPTKLQILEIDSESVVYVENNAFNNIKNADFTRNILRLNENRTMLTEKRVTDTSR